MISAGVKPFLETTLSEGANVSLITSTCSAPSERLVDAALAIIGLELQSQIKIFQCPQGPAPTVDPHGGDSQTLEQKLRVETEKVRAFTSLTA